MALWMHFVQNGEATEMGINDDVMREASFAAWEDPFRAFVISQSGRPLLKRDSGDLGRGLFETIDARG